jgi:hypothetical protein
MSTFNRNLDELLYLSKYKDKIVHHLKKNYKESVHYIIANSIVKNLDKKEQRGGHNKIIYMLSEEAFELLKRIQVEFPYAFIVKSKVRPMKLN